MIGLGVIFFFAIKLSKVVHIFVQNGRKSDSVQNLVYQKYGEKAYLYAEYVYF